jgi:catechol 2,3-dioxygenase-like lactoylglutathione lyase family enzyme
MVNRRCTPINADNIGFILIGVHRLVILDHVWHGSLTRAHPGREAVPEPDGMPPGDQLVFYLPGPVALAAATRRLREAGLLPDDPPPAYWAANRAVIFRDPDGHGVVYAPWVYAQDSEPAELAAP